MSYKRVARVGDTFSGEIKVNGVRKNITGTWVRSLQSSTRSDGKAVIVEGDIGEYYCPIHNTTEQCKAKSASNQRGVLGRRVHREDDEVELIESGHESVSVRTISGSDSTRSS